tara:strand:- start:20 stop:436 length:417 start_codon:yes stop_codon:yes gene_type:complete
MYSSAKKLPSVEILNELLKVDPSSFSGLTWKVDRRGTAKAGTKAGSKGFTGTGIPFWRVRVNGVEYLTSRVIWKMVTGKDPDQVIDHIDNNPLNNDISNLRDVTQTENLLNRRDFKLRNTNDRSFKTYFRNLWGALAS